MSSLELLWSGSAVFIIEDSGRNLGAEIRNYP